MKLCTTRPRTVQDQTSNTDIPVIESFFCDGCGSCGELSSVNEVRAEDNEDGTFISRGVEESRITGYDGHEFSVGDGVGSSEDKILKFDGDEPSLKGFLRTAAESKTMVGPSLH